MKKIIVMMLVVLVFIVMPVLAQEAKKDAPPSFAPPQPLDNALMKWMVGDWEGSMNGPMGPSKEWLGYKFGMGGQFLFMEGGTKTGAMNYKGIGALTINAKTGVVEGYWIDNFRGMYHGKGKIEGNKNIMKWDGTMGKSLRIVEKVSENKMVVSVTMAGPDGKDQTFKGELTRVKKD
ncbi:MAG: DUF1579 domain-containing protein [bacterium]|nr:DUF1579 domain-containing protein [bacterium]